MLHAKTPMHKKHKWIKQFLPNTLFGRSLLILVLPIFLIQALSTFIFFDRHWGKMTSRLAYAVAGEIAIIAHHMEADGESEQSKVLIDLAERKLDILVSYDAGQILEKQVGTQEAVGLEGMVQRTLMRELHNALDYPHQVDVDFKEKWVEVRVQLPDGILNVTLPQRRLFSSTTYIFLIWIFSVSTILLIISVFFYAQPDPPDPAVGLGGGAFRKGARC